MVLTPQFNVCQKLEIRMSCTCRCASKSVMSGLQGAGQRSSGHPTPEDEKQLVVPATRPRLMTSTRDDHAKTMYGLNRYRGSRRRASLVLDKEVRFRSMKRDAGRHFFIFWHQLAQAGSIGLLKCKFDGSIFVDHVRPKPKIFIYKDFTLGFRRAVAPDLGSRPPQVCL